MVDRSMADGGGLAAEFALASAIARVSGEGVILETTPAFVQALGMATSPCGALLEDVLTTAAAGSALPARRPSRPPSRPVT